MSKGPTTIRGEEKFHEIFTKFFANKQQYSIQARPDDLKGIYGNQRGIKPKLAIVNKDTKRKVFIDMRRQANNGGNAHERICMYLTRGMTDIGREKGNILETDFPFWLLFWGDLATDLKYRSQIGLWFQGHEGSMTLWKDIADEKPIIEHFERYIVPRLSSPPLSF